MSVSPNSQYVISLGSHLFHQRYRIIPPPSNRVSPCTDRKSEGYQDFVVLNGNNPKVGRLEKAFGPRLRLLDYHIHTSLTSRDG